MIEKNKNISRKEGFFTMKKSIREKTENIPFIDGLKIDPFGIENGFAGSDMINAENAVKAFRNTGTETDPLGMWTGISRDEEKRPVQDADDL